MKRTNSLLATLFSLLVILAACGSSTEVGTTPGDQSEGDVTEDSIPVVDDETDANQEPLPVPAQEGTPLEVQDEHIITNSTMVSPSITTPSELVLNPENDRELWVRFTGGDPNCTAASATRFTETPEMVEIELQVGITEDALTRSCMAGEFNLRVNVALDESGVGKTITAVQASPPEIQLVTPDLSLDDFVGLTEAEAAAIVEENLLTARTVRVDGEWFTVTQDFSPSRLNFEVADGIITVVTLG